MRIIQIKYYIFDTEIRLIINKLELSAPVTFDKKKDLKRAQCKQSGKSHQVSLEDYANKSIQEDLTFKFICNEAVRLVNL